MARFPTVARLRPGGNPAVALTGCALLLGCGSDAPRPTAESLGVTETAVLEPTACEPSAGLVRIDTIASGLDTPWDVAFLPDGRALITERPGRIRVITASGTLLDPPWASIDVFADAEAGLLGIDVAPESDLATSVEIYVAGTVQNLGGNAVTRILRGFGRRSARALNPERGHARYLTVFRVREVGGEVREPDVVVSGVPSGPVHAGGAVRFGPDQLLYLTTGDAADPWRAQDLRSLRGKVLRYAPDGSIPPDNPNDGSPVWASGVRNVQGLDWHPDSRDLFAIDHGPTGLEREDFRTDDDELNLVAPGVNLGWPIVTGPTEGGRLTSPIATWVPALAPAGLAFYETPGSAWHGSAFVTGLRGASLRRVVLARTDAGWAVGCEEVMLRSSYGRLRLVRRAPDGTLWVGTSNRDQNGLPEEGSDLILRLHPPRS